MSIAHTVTRSYKDQSANTISFSEAMTADNEDNLDTTLVAATPNQLITWLATRANLVSVVLYSSVAVTIYTNAASSGAPQDTIPLVAGQTKIWTLATDGIGACPFSGNVTALYVTVAGAVAPSFKLRCLKNQ